MSEMITLPDGGQQWWLNGKVHREDGPAVIWADSTQLWYVHGKLHRLDGPAYIDTDGHQEWWLNGKQVDQLVHWVMRKEFEKVVDIYCLNQ